MCVGKKEKTGIADNIHGIKEVFIFTKQLKNKREKMKIYFNLVLSDAAFHYTSFGAIQQGFYFFFF